MGNVGRAITYRRTCPKAEAEIMPPRYSLNTFYPEFIAPARPPTWDHGNPLVLDHDRYRAQGTREVRASVPRVRS